MDMSWSMEMCSMTSRSNVRASLSTAQLGLLLYTAVPTHISLAVCTVMSRPNTGGGHNGCKISQRSGPSVSNDIVIEGGVSSSRVTSWGDFRLNASSVAISLPWAVFKQTIWAPISASKPRFASASISRKKLATRIDDKLSVLAGDSSSQKVKATAMNANQKQQDTPIETETDNESDRSETVRQHWTELAHLQKSRPHHVGGIKHRRPATEYYAPHLRRCDCHIQRAHTPSNASTIRSA